MSSMLGKAERNEDAMVAERTSASGGELQGRQQSRGHQREDLKGGVFRVRSGHNILIPKRRISDENLAPKERGGLPDVRILGKAPKGVVPFDS